MSRQPWEPDRDAARAWKWLRVHGATPTEAVLMSRLMPDVDPCSPDAPEHLERFRAEQHRE